MLETIQDIKELIDTEVVNLTYKKLSSDRFGTCMSDLEKNKLNLLKDYQDLVDKLVLQTSPLQPSENSTEIVTVIDPDTEESVGEYELYITVNYLGNCIKETVRNTPYFNTDSQEVEYQLSYEYEQIVVGCTNPQSDIVCVENLIAQIKSIV